MNVDSVRSTQRAPRRCTECAQRKVKCSLTIPCEACCRRGIATSCRREVVSVRGKIVSAPSDSHAADTITALQQQVTALQDKVKSLQHSLRTERVKNTSNDRTDGSGACLSEPSLSQQPRRLTATSFGSFDDGVSSDQPDLTYPSYSPRSQPSSRQPSDPLPTESDPMSGNSISDSSTTYHMLQPVWARAERVIPGVSPEEDAFDVHALITTILFGWEESKKLVRNNPIWENVAEIFDAFHWQSIRKVEVMLMMDFIIRVMKLQASGNINNREVARATLPQFALPTPFERHLQHGFLTPKYFPHPGMREHLILNPNRYRRNGFIAAFHSQIRFLFPSIHDAYIYNKDNGQLSFSPLWLERRDNMACWTITNDFLTWYPEFIDDIPNFHQSARRLQPVGVGMGIGSPAVYEDWYNDRQERFSEPHQLRLQNMPVKDEQDSSQSQSQSQSMQETYERPDGSPQNPRWASEAAVLNFQEPQAQFEVHPAPASSGYRM